MPAIKSPGIPGKCDKVSMTYSGISISLIVILPSFTGSQLLYLVYIANPEKQVNTERQIKIGKLNHSADLADFIFLKVN